MTTAQKENTSVSQLFSQAQAMFQRGATEAAFDQLNETLTISTSREERSRVLDFMIDHAALIFNSDKRIPQYRTIALHPDSGNATRSVALAMLALNAPLISDPKERFLTDIDVLKRVAMYTPTGLKAKNDLEQAMAALSASTREEDIIHILRTTHVTPNLESEIMALHPKRRVTGTKMAHG